MRADDCKTVATAMTDRQASAWMGQGWELFKRAPGSWIGLAVVFFIIGVVAGAIPYFGPLAIGLFGPVLTYGLLVAFPLIMASYWCACRDIFDLN